MKNFLPHARLLLHRSKTGNCSIYVSLKRYTSRRFSRTKRTINLPELFNISTTRDSIGRLFRRYALRAIANTRRIADLARVCPRNDIIPSRKWNAYVPGPCSANKRIILDDVVSNIGSRYPFICPLHPQGRTKFVQRRNFSNTPFTPDICYGYGSLLIKRISE